MSIYKLAKAEHPAKLSKGAAFCAAMCVAAIVSGAAFADEITIVNAFENPMGGFFWSNYSTQCFTNTTDRTISCAALGSGEQGLREIIHQPTGASIQGISAGTGCATRLRRLRPARRRPSSTSVRRLRA